MANTSHFCQQTGTIFGVWQVDHWRSLGWLCWGLTSQSTIFQSCRDGAITSWVINQYFRGVKCLAQGHNTAEVGLEPRTSRSGVRHSTPEPPRSPKEFRKKTDQWSLRRCANKQMLDKKTDGWTEVNRGDTHQKSSSWTMSLCPVLEKL